MLPIPIIGQLVSTVGGALADRSKRKHEKKQAVHERELAHIKADTDYNYAALAQESWKDGYLTVVLTFPFLSYYIGAVFGFENLVEGTEDFFNAMSNAPDWYQYAFLGMIVASFGLKGWSMKQTLGRK